MLSNLASYFFGGADGPVEGQVPEASESAEGVLVTAPSPADHGSLTMIVNGGASRPRAPLDKSSSSEDTEDEWVMVADTAHPDPLTLGSLNEATPRPPTGSTGSSASPSESGDEDMAETPHPDPQARSMALTRSVRRLTTPYSCQSSATLSQLKAARSAQVAQQKKSAKTSTAKAIDRKNKAVKNNQGSLSKKAYTKRHNMAIKASGANKHLKQC